MAPAIAVPCPPRNLVAECTTMSAPCSSGRIRYGVATVLSMTSGTPASWATPGDHLDVEDRVLRVADRLAVEQLGVGAYGRLPGLGVVGVLDERGLDPELGQRVVQQVVGAAVQRSPGNDVIADFGDVHDRERLGRLPRRHDQRPRDAGGGRGQTTLEGGDAGLEHALGGVHDAGVDVARLGQRKEVGRVLGAVELVGGRLIDRNGSGAGCRVRLLPRMDLLGLETPTVGCHRFHPCLRRRAPSSRVRPAR